MKALFLFRSSLVLSWAASLSLAASQQAQAAELTFNHVSVDAQPPRDPWVKLAGDFNRDGKLDIASAQMHQGTAPQEVSVYLNQDRGRRWTKTVVSEHGSHDILVADFNGDGRPDILGANHEGNYQPVELWLNEGKPTAAVGPLRVDPDNPRYFTDGTGKAIYLTGSHMGWELQDHSWGREHVFDFPGFVESLTKHHHNFMRLWMVEHTRSDKANPRAVATPMPYRRTGPGTALDGRPKFDLEQFDPAYFKRLRGRVQAGGQRGVYVAVMLFQGFSLHQTRGRNPWFGHPLNPMNNINGIDGDLNGDGDGREVHTLANARVTALQEIYVNKVVDTVNDLDNVLYEIGNECGVYSTEWQYRMIRWIKQREAGTVAFVSPFLSDDTLLHLKRAFQ